MPVKKNNRKRLQAEKRALEAKANPRGRKIDARVTRQMDFADLSWEQIDGIMSGRPLPQMR